MPTPVGRQVGKTAPAAVRSHPLFQQLRQRRIALKISDHTLSKKLGYHMTTVVRWETGRQSPAFLAVLDWANALGMEVVLRPSALTLLAERSALPAKSRLMGGRA